MDDLNKLLNKTPPKWWTRKISDKKYIDFLNKKYPNIELREQLYLFYNNYNKPPQCPVCGCKPKLFKEYKTTCSRECREQYKKITGTLKQGQIKAKETSLKLYGTEYPMQSPEKQKERLKTMNRLYGGNVSEKHLSSLASRQNIMYEGRTKFYNDNYGLSNPGQLPDHSEKCKKTSLSNYGVDHWSKSEEYKKKCENNRLENLIAKIPETIKITGIKEPEEYLRQTYETPNRRYYFNCSVCNSSEELPSETFKFRLREYGTPCGKCSNVFGNVSHKEKLLLEYIKEIYNGDIIENDRKLIHPYEIDILLPNINVGIEFCGLVWHGERRKNKKYHLDKLNRCSEKNVRLVTIFEDEWEHKNQIVKDRLKYLINGDKKSYIGARKCYIKEINTPIAKNFIEEYHIQGYSNSSVKLGLFYNNQLLSVMTFSKPALSKGKKTKGKDIWELSRYCSSENVPGGASKLFSFFIKNYNPKEVYSYSDKRWNNGILYEKIGFSRVNDTEPNYWYSDYKNIKRIYRFKMRKNKSDDPNLSEWENRKLQGWDRIWDCGNYKFIWKKEEV